MPQRRRRQPCGSFNLYLANLVIKTLRSDKHQQQRLLTAATNYVIKLQITYIGPTFLSIFLAAAEKFIQVPAAVLTSELNDAEYLKAVVD